jgi:hypothetical protein
MNDCHWHITFCDDCGTEVKTRQNGGHAVLCAECANERRRIRDAEKYRRKSYHKENGLKYVIVHDPSGDYRSGACMTDVDVKFGLPKRAFEPGTVFMIRGIRKIVKYINGKYKLVMEV